MFGWGLTATVRAVASAKSEHIQKFVQQQKKSSKKRAPGNNRNQRIHYQRHQRSDMIFINEKPSILSARPTPRSIYQPQVAVSYQPNYSRLQYPVNNPCQGYMQPQLVSYLNFSNQMYPNYSFKSQHYPNYNHLPYPVYTPNSYIDLQTLVWAGWQQLSNYYYEVERQRHLTQAILISQNKLRSQPQRPPPHTQRPSHPQPNKMNVNIPAKPKIPEASSNNVTIVEIVDSLSKLKIVNDTEKAEQSQPESVAKCPSSDEEKPSDTESEIVLKDPFNSEDEEHVATTGATVEEQDWISSDEDETAKQVPKTTDSKEYKKVTPEDDDFNGYSSSDDGRDENAIPAYAVV